LSGALTPKVWTDREGNARPALDLVAHAVLSPYHVTRKRNAVQADRREADEGQRFDAWEPGALDF
jgi:hypothetical protein